MKRRIYDADHETFRGSVREFLDRQVRPRSEEFIAARSLRWLRAHERVPRYPCLARRPRDEDLGRLQRDHEGT
jgi:hypothetical protein